MGQKGLRNMNGDVLWNNALAGICISVYGKSVYWNFTLSSGVSLKEHTFHPGLIFDLPIIDCIGVCISSVVLIVSIFSVPVFLLLLTLVWSWYD